MKVYPLELGRKEILYWDIGSSKSLHCWSPQARGWVKSKGNRLSLMLDLVPTHETLRWVKHRAKQLHNPRGCLILLYHHFGSTTLVALAHDTRTRLYKDIAWTFDVKVPGWGCIRKWDWKKAYPDATYNWERYPSPPWMAIQPDLSTLSNPLKPRKKT